MLIRYKARVDAVGSRNNKPTPLHLAEAMGYPGTVDS
jgi:hypothetical protein